MADALKELKDLILAEREARITAETKRADQEASIEAKFQSLSKLVQEFDPKNSRPGFQSEVVVKPELLEDGKPKVPANTTTKIGANNNNNNDNITAFMVKGSDVDALVGDQSLLDTVMGKGAAPHLVVAPKPKTSKSGDFQGKLLDLTSDSDSDSERVDPAVAQLVSGLSKQRKKNKKNLALRKKLKVAASFAQYSRQVLKLINVKKELQDRFCGLLYWVNWLAKHEGWPVGRAYGNLWLKLAEQAEKKGGTPPPHDHLDSVLHTKAVAKAKKAIEKPATSGSNGLKLSDKVANSYPCENCSTPGHWATTCKDLCKYCGAAAGTHSCRVCSKRPGGPVTAKPTESASSNLSRGFGRGNGGGKDDSTSSTRKG